MNAKAALLLSTPYNFAGHILAEKVSSYSKEPESKLFYINHAMSYFHEPESEIWAGLGQFGSLEFMNFLPFLWLFWVAVIKEAKHTVVLYIW